MDSIIFDVDGTLWDSTESVAQSWTAYLQEKEHMDITLTSARLMTLLDRLCLISHARFSLTVQKQNSFALLMDAARLNMKLS